MRLTEEEGRLRNTKETALAKIKEIQSELDALDHALKKDQIDRQVNTIDVSIMVCHYCLATYIDEYKGIVMSAGSSY